jgi:signal transduction histidine kinase
MTEKISYDNETLLKKIEELESKLLETNSIIDAIKEGSVDALVLHQDGTPKVYSLQSADYTYRVLIEKFREGALSISEAGLILYCNDSFSRLLNKPINNIVGTFFNSYVDSVGKFEDIKNGLKTGQGKGEIMLNVEGQKIPIYISLSDLQPQVSAIGITVTDLSQKKKHEEAINLYQRQLELKVNELNQTNINLEQFVHVISHDIKEPIRKILTYSTFLDSLDADSLNKRESNALRVIKNSTQRLNSLVSDLVKYAFSTQKMELSDVDLNHILNDVTEDLELLIDANDASITFNQLPVIYGSTVQMRQLFSNLLTNAIKYRKKNETPSIHISTEIVDCIDPHYPNRKFYKVMVKDNGIGMDNKHLGKIFAIFQRLETSVNNGNGIGLAICKRIMENHSGKIEAESTPNDGSTFNMYFAVY